MTTQSQITHHQSQTCVRIAADTRPGQAAAAIKHHLLDRGSVTVSAIGIKAIGAATRAISLAGLYLHEEGHSNILADIRGERLPIGHGDNLLIINWHCHLDR